MHVDIDCKLMDAVPFFLPSVMYLIVQWSLTLTIAWDFNGFCLDQHACIHISGIHFQLQHTTTCIHTHFHCLSDLQYVALPSLHPWRKCFTVILCMQGRHGFSYWWHWEVFSVCICWHLSYMSQWQTLINLISSWSTGYRLLHELVSFHSAF